MVRWLGRKAEALGVDLFPGFAVEKLLFDGQVRNMTAVLQPLLDGWYGKQ